MLQQTNLTYILWNVWHQACRTIITFLALAVFPACQQRTQCTKPSTKMQCYVQLFLVDIPPHWWSLLTVPMSSCCCWCCWQPYHPFMYYFLCFAIVKPLVANQSLSPSPTPRSVAIAYRYAIHVGCYPRWCWSLSSQLCCWSLSIPDPLWLPIGNNPRLCCSRARNQDSATASRILGHHSMTVRCYLLLVANHLINPPALLTTSKVMDMVGFSKTWWSLSQRWAIYNLNKSW